MMWVGGKRAARGLTSHRKGRSSVGVSAMAVRTTIAVLGCLSHFLPVLAAPAESLSSLHELEAPTEAQTKSVSAEWFFRKKRNGFV